MFSTLLLTGVKVNQQREWRDLAAFVCGAIANQLYKGCCALYLH